MRGLFLILTVVSSAALADDVCSNPRPAGPVPLVTGNGFGYAVVARDGVLRSFLAHPSSTDRPLPTDGGVRTTNFIRQARWLNGAAQLSGPTTFVDDSHVIETRAAGYRLTAFSPFAVPRNVLLLTARPSSGKGAPPKGARLEITWDQPVSSKTKRRFGEVTASIYTFQKTAETLAVLPLSPKTTAAADLPACASPAANDGSPEKNACLPADSGWIFLSVEDEKDLPAAVAEVGQWRGHETAADLAAREVHDMNRWKSQPVVCLSSPDEKSLYRQSETILRLGQIREPNSATRAAHGLINASLPEGEFSIPFVRDMAYSAVALTNSPHLAEAEKAVLSYFTAREVGRYTSETNNLPYQVSIVRYFGNGVEEADHSGLPQINLELDNWGLSLWALGEYYKRTQDPHFLTTTTPRGSLYENARDFVVRPLLGNLEPAARGLIVKKDTSVWEQNDEPRRNYASSTIMAIAGLRSFLPLAQARHDEKTVKLIRKKIGLLELGFRSAFFKDGKLVGAAQRSQALHFRRSAPARNDTDGALLEAINLGVLRDPAEARALIHRVESELPTVTGGLRRTNGLSGYERQEFIFIHINLARAYLRLNELAKAETIMKRLRQIAARDNNMIPEMIQSECMPEEEAFQTAVGSPSGANPMVGYGAGAFLLYVAEREALRLGGTKTLAGGLGAPMLEDLPALPFAHSCK